MKRKKYILLCSRYKMQGTLHERLVNYLTEMICFVLATVGLDAVLSVFRRRRHKRLWVQENVMNLLLHPTAFIPYFHFFLL